MEDRFERNVRNKKASWKNKMRVERKMLGEKKEKRRNGNIVRYLL